MRLKVSSAKRWPFCVGLNVLKEKSKQHKFNSWLVIALKTTIIFEWTFIKTEHFINAKWINKSVQCIMVCIINVCISGWNIHVWNYLTNRVVPFWGVLLWGHCCPIQFRKIDFYRQCIGSFPFEKFKIPKMNNAFVQLNELSKETSIWKIIMMVKYQPIMQHATLGAFNQHGLILNPNMDK